MDVQGCSTFFCLTAVKKNGSYGMWFCVVAVVGSVVL